MVHARFVAAAIVVLGFALPAAAGTPPNDFSEISRTLKTTLADTGAPGDAVIIGDVNNDLFTGSAGKATLDTPINLSGKTDLSVLVLALSLVDCKLLSLDDPVKKHLKLDAGDPRAKVTVRELMIERARGGASGEDAAKTLAAVTEAASGLTMDALYKLKIVDALSLKATSYDTKAGIVATNGRDYGLLLATLGIATGPDNNILSPAMTNLVYRSQIIGAASCSRQDETAACNLIEQDSVGLYAWVDRSRGIYGVLSAPGAETSVAKIGREVRAEAETIFDRAHAGAGLTSAIGK